MGRRATGRLITNVRRRDGRVLLRFVARLPNGMVMRNNNVYRKLKNLDLAGDTLPRLGRHYRHHHLNETCPLTRLIGVYHLRHPRNDRQPNTILRRNHGFPRVTTVGPHTRGGDGRLLVHRRTTPGPQGFFSQGIFLLRVPRLPQQQGIVVRAQNVMRHTNNR